MTWENHLCCGLKSMLNNVAGSVRTSICMHQTFSTPRRSAPRQVEAQIFRNAANIWHLKRNTATLALSYTISSCFTGTRLKNLGTKLLLMNRSMAASWDQPPPPHIQPCALVQHVHDRDEKLVQTVHTTCREYSLPFIFPGDNSPVMTCNWIAAPVGGRAHTCDGAGGGRPPIIILAEREQILSDSFPLYCWHHSHQRDVLTL